MGYTSCKDDLMAYSLCVSILFGVVLGLGFYRKCDKAGSLKMTTALEYSTRVVQEGGRLCKKSTLNDLVHLTPLRIPLMNPPIDFEILACTVFRITIYI
jgi:hypothetical protein